jgi:hypothetical protein
VETATLGGLAPKGSGRLTFSEFELVKRIHPYALIPEAPPSWRIPYLPTNIARLQINIGLELLPGA